MYVGLDFAKPHRNVYVIAYNNSTLSLALKPTDDRNHFLPYLYTSKYI